MASSAIDVGQRHPLPGLDLMPIMNRMIGSVTAFNGRDVTDHSGSVTPGQQPTSIFAVRRSDGPPRGRGRGSERGGLPHARRM